LISQDGYARHNIWEHSLTIQNLYRRRCRKEAEEMTCAAQAAELMAPLAKQGEVLLDAGCGSGYFFHSLVSRSIPLKYIGIDATPALLQIGKQELPAFGLPEENLKVMRLEDLNGRADFVLCMNTLTYMDNYYRPLERLLQVTQKALILRESISDQAKYSYVKDDYLDPGVDLRVHINTYDKEEVVSLIEGAGFEVNEVLDRRSNGNPEMFLRCPHYWTFLVAIRK